MTSLERLGGQTFILVRKKKKECVIIDIAVQGNITTQIKLDEKVEKYLVLRREIYKQWYVQTTQLFQL